MKFLAAIQAGGQSRRMGTDKAWLEIQGQPLIERVLGAARPLANRLAVVISHTTLAPERYEKLALQWQADLLFDPHPLLGPLGGIETALHACQPNESALVLACDLPYLTTDFLSLLCQSHTHTDADITIPLDAEQRPQMLCGAYSTNCLPYVGRLLSERKLRVNQLCDLVKTEYLAWDAYAHLPHAQTLLTNLNSPEDFVPTQ